MYLTLKERVYLDNMYTDIRKKKMAASVLILNNPLCFVRNKFNKTPFRLVKNALVDFYTIVDISAAKLKLLDDIEPL